MKNRKLLLAAVYTLSFVAILWYPAEKIIRFEYPSAEPTLIKFHVGVYDPYDPMRGRYVRLDIEPSRITETGKKIPIRSRLRGSKGYIVFEKGKDGFVRLLRLEKEKPAVKKGEFTVRVSDVWSNFDYSKDEKHKIYFYQFKWPFNRFYLNELKAPELEEKLQQRYKRFILSVNFYKDGGYAVSRLEEGPEEHVVHVPDIQVK